jgi:hypothetical protein
VLLGCFGAALLVAVGYEFGWKAWSGPAEPSASDRALAALMSPTGATLPGVRQPATRAAAEAGLPDDAEVVGVEVGGRARAYLVRAMKRPTHHVLNDLLGRVPVSVTYCDLRDCVRVYTGGEQGTPLGLDVGGWRGRLILHTRGGFYTQESGTVVAPGADEPFPYTELPHRRTTWKAWREAHPDTDVYVGED